MATYYTHTWQVPLVEGQTLGFTQGKGYYAKGTPTGGGAQTAKETFAAKEGKAGLPTPVTQQAPAAALAPYTPYAPTPATAPDKPGDPVIPVPPGQTGSPDTGTRAPQFAPPAAPAPAEAPDWAAYLSFYGLPADVIAALNQIWATSLNPDGSQNVALAAERAVSYVRGTPWYAQTYPGIQAGLNAGLFNDERGYRAYQNDVNQLYQQYLKRDALPTEITGYITKGQNAKYVGQTFQAQAILGNISDPLRGLFTPEELQALAYEQAGIDTGLGQRISLQADLALKVNQMYQDFYGRGVTRSELNDLTQHGLDAQTVARQFATAANLNAIDPTTRALFSDNELHQIALDAAGGITAQGQRLGQLAKLAQQLNPLYSQYTGAGVSRADVENAYTTGTPVDTIARQFAGRAFIDANRGDIQQTAGQFDQPFTDAELKAFGEEQAGLDTPAGQLAARRLRLAEQRMKAVFVGLQAHPAFQLLGGRLAGREASTAPDLGA